jgi:predicted acyltransferase
MTNSIIKKAVSYILVILTVVFTVIALLGVWEIVNFEDIMSKLMGSLLIIFTSAAVVLFIFSVVLKNDDPPYNTDK